MNIGYLMGALVVMVTVNIVLVLKVRKSIRIIKKLSSRLHKSLLDHGK
jgi:hypothetical protein